MSIITRSAKILSIILFLLRCRFKLFFCVPIVLMGMYMMHAKVIFGCDFHCHIHAVCVHRTVLKSLMVASCQTVFGDKCMRYLLLVVG